MQGWKTGSTDRVFAAFARIGEDVGIGEGKAAGKPSSIAPQDPWPAYQIQKTEPINHVRERSAHKTLENLKGRKIPMQDLRVDVKGLPRCHVVRARGTRSPHPNDCPVSSSGDGKGITSSQVVEVFVF